MLFPFTFYYRFGAGSNRRYHVRIRYPGITPMMGVMPGLKCFIAAVIGGIGNIKGAVLGGFILGLGEILIVAFFPGFKRLP